MEVRVVFTLLLDVRLVVVLLVRVVVLLLVRAGVALVARVVLLEVRVGVAEDVRVVVVVVRVVVAEEGRVVVAEAAFVREVVVPARDPVGAPPVVRVEVAPAVAVVLTRVEVCVARATAVF